jgi:hypothetical protein
MRSFVGYVPLTQKRDVSGLGSKSLPIRISLLFLFLCSFPLTAVLTNVAPMSEKLAIEGHEKASVMTTDWR